jgi:hypothetical protein
MFVSVKVFGGFLFRNAAVEPYTIRALVRVHVEVTQNDLETPSADPGRVSFLYKRSSSLETSSRKIGVETHDPKHELL